MSLLRQSVLIAVLGASAAAGAAIAQPGPGGAGEGAPGWDRQAARAEMQARMEAHFAGADTNGDGAISEAEAAAQRAARFDEMDANGDGVLTAEEAQAHREAKRAERAGQMLQGRFDANGDGQVSRDEFLSPEDPMFARADANGDGLVTKDEIKSMVGQRRGKRGQGAYGDEDGAAIPGWQVEEPKD